MGKVRVELLPEGIEVVVSRGTTLMEAAGRGGVVVDSPCGGRGTCGKCRVRVVEGMVGAPSAEEKRLLGEEAVEKGWRLACRSVVEGDCTIEVPREVRFFDQQILEVEGGDAALEPCMQRRKVEIRTSAAGSAVSLEELVLSALGSDEPLSLSTLRLLQGVLTRGGGEVAAVMECGRVITVEEDVSGALLGVALDIGTTTVVGVLVDLETGMRLEVASRTNPQVGMGGDVISRINKAGEAGGLNRLEGAVKDCVNEIVEEMLERRRLDARNVYEMMVVGNPTMLHLFVGVSPSSIGVSPYLPVFRRSLRIRADEIGVRMNPDGVVHLLPSVAGFIGADTVGVVLSTGMATSRGRVLAVDVGTNGEIVFSDGGSLLACSTAAGPAFEGAGISCGMRATSGAISKVRVDGDVEVETVKGEPSRGICGSGLVDVVAEMVRLGLVDETGRILGPGEVPPSVPSAVRDRLIEVDGEPAFAVARNKEGGWITLTQRDLRQVQLAKGAVRAGIDILLEEVGISAGDLDEILLAGGMGNFIRRDNAKRMGLLPDVEDEKIRFVGNAALAGARLALMNVSLRKLADEIAARMRFVELANRPSFQERFASAMLFDKE